MRLRFIARAALVIAAALMSMLAAEAGFRALDGYRLSPTRLTLRNTTPAPNQSDGLKWYQPVEAAAYVRQLPLAAGVDADWFVLAPPIPERFPANPELTARASRYPDASLQANYEWNRNVARHAICRSDDPNHALLTRFDDVFTFDPTDGSDFPTYRYLRSATYPSGLRTNAFGWRSEEIALLKPRGVVRIAFVGASTTVGAHALNLSYPELVGFWLNRWAEGRGVRFEVINSGREGVNSHSLAAIVRQELIPTEPDLVVYYEGSNQFWPVDFIGTPLPPRSRSSAPEPSGLTRFSAVIRRIEAFYRRTTSPGEEPPKPTLFVAWPRDLSEHDPNLGDGRLPIELPRILDDLESIRTTLAATGSRLVMTSFMWLVDPGMRLDVARDRQLFDYLNTTMWPFTYAHIRRFVDFENRVFRKFAAAHGLGFVDLAGEYPRDPRLFDDPIHMTAAGVHLQAWIVFNGLIPILEKGLAEGEWPRDARRTMSRHPAFSNRRLTATRDLGAVCAPSQSQR